MATAKELRAAAELLRACYSTDKCNDLTPGYEQAADLLSDHILATVRDDDDESVTVEWMDATAITCNGYGARRYEVTPGIRVMAFACSGGWSQCELWTGSGDGHRVHQITRGDVRRLCSALGIPLPATK